MGNTTTKESAVYHKLTKIEKDKIEELKQIYPDTFSVRIVNKTGQVLVEYPEDNKEIKNLSLPEALQINCLSSDETPRILHIKGSKNMFTLVGFTDEDAKFLTFFTKINKSDATDTHDNPDLLDNPDDSDKPTTSELLFERDEKLTKYADSLLQVLQDQGMK